MWQACSIWASTHASTRNPGHLSNHHALPSSDQCSLQQHIVIVNFNRGPALMAFKHHCFLIQPAVTDCGKPACLPEELHGDHLFGKHWISGNLTAVTNWPSQGNVREKFCHRKFYVWATIQIMQALCHHLTADFAAYWVTVNIFVEYAPTFIVYW